MRHFVWIICVLFCLSCCTTNNSNEENNTPATNKKSRALVVGVDVVDKSKYSGTISDLPSCINDAKEMKKILENKGYDVTMLVGSKNEGTATKAKFIDFLKKASEELSEEDNLVIFYSGHGTQVYDSGCDEPDYYDEALCLYDGLLLDDKLYEAFKKLNGVNTLFISDSCHAASLFKSDENKYKIFVMSEEKEAEYEEQIQKEQTDGTCNRPETDAELAELKNFIMVGACKDEQLSGAGNPLSVFTRYFVKIYNDNSNLDYNTFFVKVKDAVNNASTGQQTPQITTINASTFAAQKLFSH